MQKPGLEVGIDVIEWRAKEGRRERIIWVEWHSQRSLPREVAHAKRRRFGVHIEKQKAKVG